MTVIKFDHESDGVYRVVDAFQLEHETLCGWQLVAALAESDVATMSETVPHPKVGQPDHYGGDTLGVEKAHVFAKTRFLLRKDDASVRGEQQGQIEKLREVLLSERHAKEAETKRADEAEALAERHLGEIKRDNAQITDLRTRFDMARTAKDKLEADLGRVRAAVGDIRFKEILAVDSE